MKPLGSYLERFLRIPMALEPVLQRLLQFLAEQIDASSRQLIVQIRDDEIQRHLDFHVHDDDGAVGVGWRRRLLLMNDAVGGNDKDTATTDAVVVGNNYGFASAILERRRAAVVADGRRMSIDWRRLMLEQSAHFCIALVFCGPHK